ncbi:MAG: hypothetical protein PGN13_07875 [Patulibacter minatonensis]
MRAVNLVPPEARQGRVSPGKSGGAVFGVLGALLLVLVMVSALAVIKKDKSAADAELAQVTAATQAYEAAANQFSSFESAATQAKQRIELVRGLSRARFDWAGTLRDMARLVPADTQIFSLDASVKDGASQSGGSSQVRSQIASSPAISLKGCSRSQTTVANLVTRLQAMRRVTNVTLEASETEANLSQFDKRLKSVDEAAKGPSTDGASADGAGAGTGDEECSLPQPNYGFSVTVFYAPGNAQASSDAIPQASTSTASTIGAESVGATTPGATPVAGN